ncbi:unnamed protein product [Tetraodon nigroviridis]|uniref:(spotted green pufferfish) hypothetical protein n=1 Tax=Tetraodon nigroviridis TaxID=99883 RepID=Q4RJQ0_TETNG|nr:unnamed protein product [Tetraodon nigroviridis]
MADPTVTQNMFQEGLYHVFFRDSPRGAAQVSSSGGLTNARIHRWFGTVFMAAGCLAVEVQRKANKLKVNEFKMLHLYRLCFR